jgi:hypothetical protein
MPDIGFAARLEVRIVLEAERRAGQRKGAGLRKEKESAGRSRQSFV